MNSRYKLTISNKRVYKEIEIPADTSKLSIGTAPGCDIRLRKDDFFEPIALLISRNGETWAMACAENLYFNEGGVAKLMAKKLQHGDEFEIRYQSSDQLAFRAEFQIDFAGTTPKFERSIDVSNCKSITIGSASSCDINLQSDYSRDSFVELIKEQGGFRIAQARTPFGLSLNGRKAQPGEIIKDSDFFSISDCFFYFREDQLWTERDGKVGSERLKSKDKYLPEEYPKFTRNTRIKTVINDEKIEILDPPSKPQKPKNNLILRLLPSLGMLVASGVMAMQGGGMIILSAISGLMAIITSVLSVRESNKDFKKDSADRIEKYNSYAEKKKAEITKARQEERDELEDIYISMDKELQLLSSFSPNLFDRQKEDEDFLCVRLGEGRIEAKRVIDYKKKEKLEVEDDLQNIPERLSEEFKCVESAPVVCDFKENHAIGISGTEDFRHEFMKKMVVDIVSRHYHTDVRIAVVATEEKWKRIDCLRFLPHIKNPVSDQRNIACDEESKNQLFEYLYNELNRREQSKSFDYNIVVFFIDEFGFKNHPISKYVDKANELGVTFVFFEESNELLPQGCSNVICPSDDGNKAILIESANKNKAIEFSYQIISDDQLLEIVKILAPVYTEELSLEGSLTKNLSLFEMMNVLSADEIDLSANWKSSKAYKTMAAPIGVSNTGIVELDLHDKAHGPHGLVAGTTGSGKSELLQTYILSMAALYHPYEVGFVIIDFKGGGMANQFKELPHLIGTITNIDGKEIDRSLKSIKAELQKRQRLFAEADVNHIDKYIRKYRNHDVTIPIPHLIIIVDEFAELKAEQPDFMKELISAARIGRSLGVHLILATQKPAGQVDDQIWSNSRFKMCLKVQSPEDSNEVLKSPLAAEIKEPGRAYLQVGNNEIFELFQSAYSGAPEREGDSNIREFSLYQILNNGKRALIYQQKKEKAEEGSKTQLDAVVSHINDSFKKMNIPKLPPICLPSLEKQIPFPHQVKTKLENGIVADVGVYDDPENQLQKQYSINLSKENVMIIGSSQTGKTNLLQTIIRSVSTKYSPEEVNLYVIDFASMFLKTFENLAHVGGVVTPSEDEKLKNLIKLIQRELVSRKEKLLSVGVSSYSSYLEAGMKEIPQIVLIIDNLTALKELYFEDDEDLLTICREGQTLGISVIIANASTTGIGFKYLSNFSLKLALFNNDSSEYNALFDHCRERIQDIKGRSIVEIEKKHFECQVFLAFEGDKEIERINYIRSYIDSVNAIYHKSRAKQIPEIPKILTQTFIEDTYHLHNNKYELILGLDYENVSPVTLNLAHSDGPIVFTGKERKEQISFIKSIVHVLDKDCSGQSVVYIVDNINRELSDLSELNNVAGYSNIHLKATEFLSTVEETLSKRLNNVALGQGLNISEEKLVILLLNNLDSLATISDDFDAFEKFKDVLGRYKNLNVCLIIGDFDNTNISYSSPDAIRYLKENGLFLFNDVLDNMKVIDLSYGLLNNNKKYEKGDYYLVKENAVIRFRPINSLIN